ncbi:MULTISPECIES: AAA family ATPase [unclassified Methylophilus]|uniref:AAA family ATPase n=1 Tax=unclassified Methylophilus TaxID=2630143 RepID=UPI0003A6AC6C|nr:MULTISPECIES: AAA family ATPase [unclassified Methylophilus]
MASAINDFRDFVAWLHSPASNASPNVKRLANLILQNFDRVLATSRQRSQRSVYLAGLCRNQLATVSDAMPEPAPELQNAVWPWVRLNEFSIGPFRGFRSAETFDLSKRVSLFYGPNGSGKSSFCEGLEYALLGSVEEAGAKRIDQESYLSNTHEGRYLAPSLSARDQQNQVVAVVPNLDSYRFCFIEKNRIDAFSRIAARTPAQKTELIATLFGMDKFNDFVNNFNESMDDQLIRDNVQGRMLETRRRALAQDQALVDNQVEGLSALDDEEAQLANSYSDGMNYQQLKALIGTTDAPARLQELTTLLDVLPPAIFNVTLEALQSAYANADSADAELQAIRTELALNASQISFHDLYTAVIALQPTEGDHCPACDTPLNGENHVLHDPYQKASEGLESLRALSEMQVRHDELVESLDNASRDLHSTLSQLREFLVAVGEQNSAAGSYLEGLPESSVERWWVDIYDEESLVLPTLEDIQNIARRCESQDIETRRLLENRQQNINERNQLLAFQLSVQQQDGKRQSYVERVQAATQSIANFEELNAELIRAVGVEAGAIQRDAPIKVAYDQFNQLLRRYRSTLPGRLIAGLNQSAMDLYNAFNRNDLDQDKLAALHLPVTADQKIEIAFRGNPNRRVDALKILSEGHIRCLGLAILLAKSLSINTPLIVFDDAINAIDHDHRRGIRETIFESEYFINMQIIVTCHSNEFIKDIQQNLNEASRRDSLVYIFRNHSGDYSPRVSGNIRSRNYVQQARDAREELNDRGALDASRKALEMLSEKIWRWLGSYDHGMITLPLAGVGAEPSLRNLCEALRKKMMDLPAFNHASKDPAIAALNTILGIPQQNLVWLYLNNGTHEVADRDDFDGDHVESIVTILERLENLELRPNR